MLFSQRCSGCHTLSYAATHGSAPNVRTAQSNNGPNFDVRCERPVTRVLYAIENGGFSGAIMPQNIVVGQDARDVAEFVSKYAGRQAPKVAGRAAVRPAADRLASARRTGHDRRLGRGDRHRAGGLERNGAQVVGVQDQLGQEQHEEHKKSHHHQHTSTRSLAPEARSVLDIRLIRRDPDAVRAALGRRGPDAAAAIDRVLELDERWRALTAAARGAARRAEPRQPRPQGAAHARGARAAGRAGRPRPRAQR